MTAMNVGGDGVIADYWLSAVNKFYRGRDVEIVKEQSLASLGDALVALSRHRLDFVVRRLRAAIGEDVGEGVFKLGTSASNEFERTLFVVGLACRCFEGAGDRRKEVDSGVVAFFCEALSTVHHQNYLAWAATENPSGGRRVAKQCMSSFALLSGWYQEAALATVRIHMKNIMDKRTGPDEVTNRLTCIAYLRLDVKGLALLFDMVQEVFRLMNKEMANNSPWCRRVTVEISNPFATCIRDWVGKNRAFVVSLYDPNGSSSSSSSSRNKTSTGDRESSSLSTPPPSSSTTMTRQPSSKRQERYERNKRSRDKFVKCALGLLQSMMPITATGTRKRCSVWPAIVLVACLVPEEWQPATACMDIVQDILERTAERFNPSMLGRMVTKDVSVFTDASLLAYLNMTHVAATISHHVPYVGSVLGNTVRPNEEKMLKMLLAGDCPSSTYATAVENSLWRLEDHPQSASQPWMQLYMRALYRLDPARFFSVVDANLLDAKQHSDMNIKMAIDIVHDSLAVHGGWAEVTAVTAAAAAAALEMSGGHDASGHMLHEVSMSSVADREDREDGPVDGPWQDEVGRRIRFKILAHAVGGVRVAAGGVSSIDQTLQRIVNSSEGSRSSRMQRSSIFGGLSSVSAAASATTAEVAPATLRSCLTLYGAYPGVLFDRCGTPSAGGNEATSSRLQPCVYSVHLSLFLLGMCRSLDVEGSSESTTAKEEFFVSMFRADSGVQLQSERDICSFFTSAFLVVEVLASMLLARREQESTARHLRLLKVLRVVLLHVNDMAGRPAHNQYAEVETRQLIRSMHRGVIGTVEAALVFHACSPFENVNHAAILALGDLCDQRDIIAGEVFSSSLLVDELDTSASIEVSQMHADVWLVYREACNSVISATKNSPGYRQGSYSRSFFGVNAITPGLNRCLWEMVVRWALLKEKVLSSAQLVQVGGEGGLSEKEIEEWTSRTAFLCGLGHLIDKAPAAPVGVADSLSTSVTSVSTSLDDDLRSTSATSTEPSAAIPALHRTSAVAFPDGVAMASEFVDMLVKQVLSGVRDWRVKIDVLMGKHLSASLVLGVFAQLVPILDTFLLKFNWTLESGAGTSVLPPLPPVTPARPVSPQIGQSESDKHARWMQDIRDMTPDQDLDLIIGLLMLLTQLLERSHDEWGRSELFELLLLRLLGAINKMDAGALKAVPSPTVRNKSADNTGRMPSTDLVLQQASMIRMKKKITFVFERLLADGGGRDLSHGTRMQIANTVCGWLRDSVALHCHDEAIKDGETSGGRSGAIMPFSEAGAGGADLKELKQATKSVAGLAMRRELEVKMMPLLATVLRGMSLAISHRKLSSEVLRDRRNNLFLRFFSILHVIICNCQYDNDDGQNTELAMHTAEAISNLLAGNMDIGFRYALDASTFSRSPGVRAAFLNILSEVVQVGSRVSPDAASPGSPGMGCDDGHSALLGLKDFLSSSDMSFWDVVSSAFISKTSTIADGLLDVFEDDSPALLTPLIRLEIANTQRMASLFRNESLAIKCLGKYFHRRGLGKLKATLTPVLRDFLARSPDIEITSQMTEEVRSARVSALIAEVEVVLGGIISGSASWPQELRSALCTLREVSLEKFGKAHLDCERVSVCGFFFLRFVCPVLMLPHVYGLISEEEYTTVRPKLSLIAKVLQYLANGTNFADGRMSEINEWLRDAAPRMEGFGLHFSATSSWRLVRNESMIDDDGSADPSMLVSFAAPEHSTTTNDDGDKISNCKLNSDNNTIGNSDDNVNTTTAAAAHVRLTPTEANALMSLHVALHDARDTLITGFARKYGVSDEGPGLCLSALSDEPAAVALASYQDCLEVLGEPSDEARVAFHAAHAHASANKSSLKDVLKALAAAPGVMAQLDAARRANVVYSVARASVVVVHIICRRCCRTTSPDTVVYMLLHELDQAFRMDIPIELVVDSTLVTDDSAFGGVREALGRVLKDNAHILSALGSRLEAATVVYPSTALLTLFKGLLSDLGIPLEASVLAKVEMVNAAHVLQSKPRLMEKLPSSTLETTAGIERAWSCTVAGHYPGSVQLGFGTRVCALESGAEVGGKSIILTDMYDMSSIDKVTTKLQSVVEGDGIDGAPATASGPLNLVGRLFTRSDTMTLHFKTDAREWTMELSSPQVRQMVTARLTAIKASHQQDKIDAMSRHMNALRPLRGAVPGFLLHSCLLNLTMPSHAVRQSAYNLLAFVYKSFGISPPTVLLPSSSICVPLTPSFAVELSAELAAHSPALATDFIAQATHTLGTSDPRQWHLRVAALQVVLPWIGNVASEMSDRAGKTAAMATADKTTDEAADKTDADDGGDEDEDKAVLEGLQRLMQGLFQTVLMASVPVKDSCLHSQAQEAFWACIAQLPVLSSLAVEFFMRMWAKHELVYTEVDLADDVLFTSFNKINQEVAGHSLLSDLIPNANPRVQSTRASTRMRRIARRNSTSRNTLAPGVGGGGGGGGGGGAKTEAYRKRLSSHESGDDMRGSALDDSKHGGTDGASAGRAYQEGPVLRASEYNTPVLPEPSDARETRDFGAAMNSAVVVIAQHQSQAVMAALTARLSFILTEAKPYALSRSRSFNSTKRDNHLWLEAVALMRPLLNLCGSFQRSSAHIIEEWAATIAHLICLSVSNGPKHMRPGVHALACHLAHGLLSTAVAVSRVMDKSDDGLVGRMAVLIASLEDANALVNSKSYHESFYFTPEITVERLDAIFELLAAIVVTDFPGRAELGRARRDHWSALTGQVQRGYPKSLAAARCALVTAHLVVRGHAGTGTGAGAAGPVAIADDTWASLVGYLGGALQNAESGGLLYAQSMLVAVTRLVPLLPLPTVRHLFWLGLGQTLTTANQLLSLAAIRLTIQTVSELCRRMPLADSIEEFLLGLFTSPSDSATDVACAAGKTKNTMSAFADGAGLVILKARACPWDFTYLLAAVLHRGMWHPACEQDTTAVLRLLHVRWSTSPATSARSSGYMVLLAAILGHEGAPSFHAPDDLPRTATLCVALLLQHIGRCDTGDRGDMRLLALGTLQACMLQCAPLPPAARNLIFPSISGLLNALTNVAVTAIMQNILQTALEVRSAEDVGGAALGPGAGVDGGVSSEDLRSCSAVHQTQGMPCRDLTRMRVLILEAMAAPN